MDLTSKALSQLWTTGMLSSSLLLVTVLLLLCYYQFKLWSKYSKIPGPRPLPFLGNLLEFIGYEIDILRSLSGIIKRFNGFAKIWVGTRPLVLISDPEHLRILYTNPTTTSRSSLMYEDIAGILGKDSIFCANGERWKKMRKMMIMSFHSTPAETFLKNFLVTQKDLTKSFLKKADGSTFRCNFTVKKMLLNSIMLSATGNQLSESDTAKFVIAEDYALHYIYTRKFTLHLRYDWIFHRLPSGRKYLKHFHFVQKLLSDLVDKKKVEMQLMAERGELIPNLYIYNMLQKFGDEPLDGIKSELLNLIGTGMDTVANFICFTLMICGFYPEIQEKIYQEDQKVMKSLAGKELEIADLDKYEFLDRVIKETLRVLPVAPMIGRKLGEDTYFGEYLVPKGTDILAMSYVTLSRPDVFPDPQKFDPDRFLPENVEKRHPFAYNPFSAGSRGCPGNRYAQIGMKTIVSAIVRDFVIKTHYRSLEELKCNVRAEITLSDKEEFPIRIFPRRHVE